MIERLATMEAEIRQCRANMVALQVNHAQWSDELLGRLRTMADFVEIQRQQIAVLTIQVRRCEESVSLASTRM